MTIEFLCSRALKKVLAATFCVLALNACGGGISGTGGSSNRIFDPDITSGPSTTPDGSLPVKMSIYKFRNKYFPRDIRVKELTHSLVSVTRRLERKSVAVPENTLISDLLDRLHNYSVEVFGIYKDIGFLHQKMYGALNECEPGGVCQSIPSAVSIENDVDEEILNYHSIKYERGISGYFDSRLEYTSDSGNEVSVRWSHDEDLIALYSSNSEFETYALLESNPLRITFRQVRKSDGQLTQTTIKTNSARTRTKIEADLEGWYVKVRMEKNNAVLYGLTDDELLTRREAIVVKEEAFLIESCSTADCIWQPEHDRENEIFDQMPSGLEDFGETYIHPALQFRFSEESHRLVVMRDSGDVSEVPVPGSLLCGGKTILGNQRNFCWSPLPFNESTRFFEESISGGSFSYREINILE